MALTSSGVKPMAGPRLSLSVSTVSMLRLLSPVKIPSFVALRHPVRIPLEMSALLFSALLSIAPITPLIGS